MSSDVGGQYARSTEGGGGGGCCCCGARCDCPRGFQKVLELKDVGLVVYRHTVRTEERNKISGLLETATKTTDNVFILQNTKSTELTSAQYLPGIEGTKLTCPRCRKLAEQVYNLLQKAPNIEKRHVTGICDRCCLMRGKPCDTCERILSKFLSNRRGVSEGTKTLIRQWLAKIEHILDDITGGAAAASARAADQRWYGADGRYGTERIRASSELYIDQILIRSRKDTRQLDIKPLFRPRGITLDERGQFVDDRSRLDSDMTSRLEFEEERYRDRDREPYSTRLPRRSYDDEPRTRRSHSQESIPTFAREAGGRARDYGESDRYKRRGEGRDFTEAGDVTSQRERYGDRGEMTEIYGRGDAREFARGELKSIEPTTKKDTRMYTSETDLTHRDDDRSIDEFGKSKGRSKGTKADDRKYDETEASRSKAKDLPKREEKDSYTRGKGDGRDGVPAERKDSKTLKKINTEVTKGERAEKEQKQRDKYETSKSERDKDAKDKSGQEQKQKGEKDLSAKDKGRQEPKHKGEKDLSTKDRDGQEQKQKGEKDLSAKDKGRQELKQKAEKDLSTKERGGQESKQKGEKGLSTKDKGGQEQKQKGEKDLSTKDKGGQEQKQKGEKDLSTKDKGGQEQKQKGKGEKESDLKDKGAVETRKKGKGEKELDTKDTDEKEPKEKEKDNKEIKANKLTPSMEKMYAFPKERAERPPKIVQADVEKENKAKKTGKKKEKKVEDKQKQSNKTESIEEIKEIAVNKICVRRASPDDHILTLVRLKQAIDSGPRRVNVDETVNIEHIIRDHLAHKHEGRIAEQCPFCHDSDYGLDSLLRPPSPEFADVIVGQKVFKYRPPLVEQPEELEPQPVVPALFKSTYQVDNIEQKSIQTMTPSASTPDLDTSKPSKKARKQSKAEPETGSHKGIVRYALSDRSFIEKGWTMLPTEKVVRKMNVYRMRPAHPEFNWFEADKLKRLMTYESGEPLAEFDDDGRGHWYYRNGRLALDYYDTEGLNAQQRFVVWSSGEPDERGRAQPYTVLATFDYLGNGIVLDHTGKIRLKYNQTEGVVLDRSIGPVSHWKWHALNDPPVLAPVMIDTQEALQDPRLVKLGATGGARGGDAADRAAAAAADHAAAGTQNDDMLAIEFDNFVRAKSEKLTQTFKPFQIRMKALKINEYFSLRVLDQASVYLLYRDGTTNLKLNLGMVLDHHEIVDTDMADMGEVCSELERFPARTASLAALQRGVQHAQRCERRRAAREARLRPALPAPSADRLAAPASRPSPHTAHGPCRCSRKPTGPNLYYDNRIF